MYGKSVCKKCGKILPVPSWKYCNDCSEPRDDYKWILVPKNHRVSTEGCPVCELLTEKIEHLEEELYTLKNTFPQGTS